MTVVATLQTFRQAVLEVVEKHSFQADVTLEEKRGIILHGGVNLDQDAFVAAHFDSLSGKTSCAPIWQDCHLNICGNYRLRQYHPPEEANCWLACVEPRPGEAIAMLVEVSQTYS